MKYLTIVLLFFLFSCTKIIEINLPDAPDKLVINCLFSSGEKFTVHLSHSLNILDEDSTEIKNADIRIYSNEVYQGTMEYNNNGFYTHDTIIARPGIKYKLIADAPGYDQVEAEDTAPVKPVLDSVFYDPNAYIDSEGSYFYKVEVLLEDNHITQDFYEIILLYFDEDEEYSVIRLRGNNDKVIRNEGDEEFYSDVCLFSDELINGSLYWLRLKISDSEMAARKELHFLSISETLYRYRKSWIRHSNAQYPDITNPIEPVILFSNVKGGYGIFAGYSETISISY